MRPAEFVELWVRIFFIFLILSGMIVLGFAAIVEKSIFWGFMAVLYTTTLTSVYVATDR